MINDRHTLEYMAVKEAYTDVCCPVCTKLLLDLDSMRQLMVDQLVVGTTGRTALGISFMEPEPHNGSVVFLTCRKEGWFTWFVFWRFVFCLSCASLTKTAHQPLVSSAWHNVRVLPGASILFGLQDTVGVLEWEKWPWVDARWVDVKCVEDTTFPCLRACRARRSSPVACSSSVGIPEKWQ